MEHGKSDSEPFPLKKKILESKAFNDFKKKYSERSPSLLNL